MPISASSRIDARLRPEQKSRIERAASLKGTSVSEFMIQNADEAAIRTIREYESWALTVRDRDAFVKALLHPPSPNTALRKAAQRYRQRANK
ncbi:MAG TPA: DUF1778 domain-containing protein [Acidobacteriaceae bacterium]|jgi:uncharacterized protein (DUF1778 family)